MARPQKTNCDYFSHDNDMRNHRKIKALRKQFEHGYSFWCMFLEVLTESDNNRFDASDLELEMLSGDFGITATEIRDMINYCVKINLLSNDFDGFLHSTSLDERLKCVYAKRARSKALADKKLRNADGSFCDSNSGMPFISETETP